MDTRQVNTALTRIFDEEEHRIVYWNDPEGEFLHDLPVIIPSDVKLLNLDEIGQLEAKVCVERDDPDGRFLLYSPHEEPEYEDDWLLDIRLYSRSFRADRASIILAELGLARQQLRDYLNRRRKFFDNKERFSRLKQLVVPEDTELDLDRKMLAVVTRSDQAELFNILRTLLHSMTEGDEIDLELVPPAWEQIEKFNLDESFWEMVKVAFGYEEESPSLRNLLIRLFVSDFAHHLEAEPPASLRNLQLTRAGTDNAVVCLAQWRDSSSKASSYNALATEVAAHIRLEEFLGQFEIESLLKVFSFLDADKAIIRGLLERVSATTDAINPEEIRAIGTRRQAGHWVFSVSIPEIQRKARRAVYEAISLAAELFALRNRYQGGFEFETVEAMYKAYETELFRFDQLYRLFCENADRAESQGWHMLKSLRADVEACYTHGYLPKLALGWGKFLDAKFLENWKIPGEKNEYQFFESHVKPHLRKREDSRAFVIVSDAFRFEIAEEFTRILNGTYRYEAELGSQLSILPSYTALGMASLLPHKTISYKPNGDVLVDGRPTASLDQRNDILVKVDGMAIRADDLLAMNQKEGRETIAGKRIVYIYHDEIDSRGEKASTEGDTFDACRNTLVRLQDVVRYVINTLNGNHVLVTADHGFLFTEASPSEIDKSKLNEKPSGCVIAKKRYLLGTSLPDSDDAWHGSTATTALAEGGMEFWVPKGTNRFHFAGGARFIHGGAMLQEIVVPVITIKHLKDKAARAKTRTKHVTVHVMGGRHRITSPKHRFTLLQMEPASERAKPVTLKVAVYEGDEVVTSIERVTFDSTSSSIDETRQKAVTLTLQDREYDKKTTYRLVLRNADTDVEAQSADVTIDRAIADDFDF